MEVRFLAGLVVGMVVVLSTTFLVVRYVKAYVGPRLSTSLIFNQKALWLKSASSCDILIIGSSMGLNNVDGSELVNRFPAYSVVNASSWSMSVGESKRMFESLSKRCAPKFIILPLYFGDLITEDGATAIDWTAYDRYMDDGESALDRIRRFDLIYEIGSAITLKQASHATRQSYNAMAFDSTGGVALAAEGFPRNRRRWTNFRHRAFGPFKDSQIKALLDLAQAARSQRIKLFVLRLPMTREASEFAANSSTISSWRPVADAVHKGGGVYIDASNLALDDSQFVDCCHLNERGSGEVTRQLLPWMFQNMAR